ncbi:unnamed protein product [Cuscuta epithymum]|uniref:Uncharacterized protein n=1 Tax=Cuscuta epithymum TaxID=186058 RepID=A0AAV0DUJ7_9ASTE|nr:unnamed protein product [Cuscuta epithymum]
MDFLDPSVFPFLQKKNLFSPSVQFYWLATEISIMEHPIHYPKPELFAAAMGKGDGRYRGEKRRKHSYVAQSDKQDGEEKIKIKEKRKEKKIKDKRKNKLVRPIRKSHMIK